MEGGNTQSSFEQRSGGQELMARCLERGYGWLCPSCIKEGRRRKRRGGAVERWGRSPGIILMKSRVPGGMEAGRDLYSRYVKNGAQRDGRVTRFPRGLTDALLASSSVSPDPEVHPLSTALSVLTHTVSGVSATFPRPPPAHQIHPFWSAVPLLVKNLQ